MENNKLNPEANNTDTDKTESEITAQGNNPSAKPDATNEVNSINLASDSNQINAQGSGRPKKNNAIKIILIAVSVAALLAAILFVTIWLLNSRRTQSTTSQQKNQNQTPASPANPAQESLTIDQNGLSETQFTLSDGSTLIIKNLTDKDISFKDSTGNTINVPANSEYEYIIVSENANNLSLETLSSPKEIINIRINE